MVEKTITVGGDLNGKTLALVALKMENAADLNLYLGEFSIVRGSFDAPAQPIDVKTPCCTLQRMVLMLRLSSTCLTLRVRASLLQHRREDFSLQALG